jgi:hypothetical protein
VFQIGNILKYLIALVWLINGLWCKVLNMVPRHNEIVGEIFGKDLNLQITMAIGFGEIFIVLWIISGSRQKWCALFQIILIMTMNIIEFVEVPHLLFFGRWNILIAILFSTLIYLQAFVLPRESKPLLKDA